MSQIGSVVDCWWVVDQGSGSRDDSGMSTEDSGSNKGKVGSCGFSNLWGNLDWLRCNTGVNWGNKGFWVEGGGNNGIDWSNGQTRVSNAESSCISDILNLLK